MNWNDAPDEARDTVIDRVQRIATLARNEGNEEIARLYDAAAAELELRDRCTLIATSLDSAAFVTFCVANAYTLVAIYPVDRVVVAAWAWLTCFAVFLLSKMSW